MRNEFDTFAGARFGQRCPKISLDASREDMPPALTTISTDTFLDADPAEVLAIVATASSWPSIVLSSTSVKGQTNRPLRPGDSVEEYFGVPPLWSPCVQWTCKSCDFKKGILDVQSSDGVDGLADSCRMLFTAREEAGGTRLRLDMSYRPRGWLAKLARPLLELDNTLALRVLLPSKVKSQFPQT